jgi:hypothetical protein
MRPPGATDRFASLPAGARTRRGISSFELQANSDESRTKAFCMPEDCFIHKFHPQRIFIHCPGNIASHGADVFHCVFEQTLPVHQFLGKVPGFETPGNPSATQISLCQTPVIAATVRRLHCKAQKQRIGNQANTRFMSELLTSDSQGSQGASVGWHRPRRAADGDSEQADETECGQPPRGFSRRI